MDIIQGARVKVDGKVITEPSFDIKGTEEVVVDDKPVVVMSYQYIMLHKPVGYTTTKEDRHADHTVMDILPEDLYHLSPIGRLDRDSSGLLLFTNDGNLAFKLTHPSFHEDKTYQVVLSGEANKQKLDQLRKGVEIEGKKTLPCRIEDVVYNTGFTRMTMIIQEGRKRQIRLMAQAVGHHVVTLVRVATGKVKLGDLPVGSWRALTKEEVQLLQYNAS